MSLRRLQSTATIRPLGGLLGRERAALAHLLNALSIDRKGQTKAQACWRLDGGGGQNRNGESVTYTITLRNLQPLAPSPPLPSPTSVVLVTSMICVTALGCPPEVLAGQPAADAGCSLT